MWILFYAQNAKDAARDKSTVRIHSCHSHAICIHCWYNVDRWVLCIDWSFNITNHLRDDQWHRHGIEQHRYVFAVQKAEIENDEAICETHSVPFGYHTVECWIIQNQTSAIMQFSSFSLRLARDYSKLFEVIFFMISSYIMCGTCSLMLLMRIELVRNWINLMLYLSE